MRARC
jgi:hypothetical protein